MIPNSIIHDMAVISAPETVEDARLLPRIRGGQSWLMWVGAALILWPALYNGFPLIFSDTGTYISQAMELHLGWDRPPFYSFLVLATGWGRSLWPVVVGQCLASAWLIRRVQIMVAPDAGVVAGIGLLAVLAVMTTLPWTAAEVMPDIFTPMMALAMAVLLFEPRLAWGERAALMAVILLAIMVHLSNLPIGVGLCLCIALPMALAKRAVRWVALLLPVGVGVGLLCGVNLAATGRAAVAPYGSTFILARLLATGPARDTLARDCPTAGWALCAFRDDLPRTGDGFLWRHDSPLYKAGGPVRLIGQTNAIVDRTIAAEPRAVIRQAIDGFATQMVSFAPGHGLRPWRRTAGMTIRRDLAPGASAAFEHGLQGRGRLAVPEGMIGLDAVLAVIGFAVTVGFVSVTAGDAVWRRLRDGAWRCPDARLLGFSVLVLLVLMGNAAVTGALSGPHERYQSRVVWLVTMSGMLIVLRYARQGTERLKNRG